jgi:peptide/nickel transport system substrate-binding protein
VRRGVRRALHPGAARPDFYTGIVGGRACLDDPASCDLRHGVVVDDAERRVTFHLVAPDPEFLWKLTMLVVPTPPGTPLGPLASPLPSTGPYRVAAFRRSRTLTLTRNPRFREWSAAAQPAGFVDAIDWLKVRDARAAADAVRHGRADLSELNSAGGLDPVSLSRLIDRLRVSAPSHLHRSMRMGTGYVVVNSSLPPFDDVRVRRAFNFAFDRTKVGKLLGGPSHNHLTCQLLPPGMPSYRPYCPYTSGSPRGPYRGPDLARARALVRASGTRGAKVTVTEVTGLFDGPLEPYLVGVLRSLGYQASLRSLPDTPRNRERLYDPRSGVQVMTDGFFADYPLPSNFYDILTCAHSSVFSPSAFCDRDLDHRVAVATRMLQTAPGAALRAWTRIDRAFTDRAPLVPFANFVIWWITSERLGNYQNGGDTNGPLLSQLWVR